jgi:hypothetical protein
VRAFDWLRGLRNGLRNPQRQIRRWLSTPDALEPRVVLALDSLVVDLAAKARASQQFGADAIDGTFSNIQWPNAQPHWYFDVQPFFGHIQAMGLLEAYEHQRANGVTGLAADVNLMAVSKWLEYCSKSTGLSEPERGAISGVTGLQDRRLFFALKSDADPMKYAMVEFQQGDGIESTSGYFLLLLSKYVEAGGALSPTLLATAKDAVDAMGLVRDEDGLFVPRRTYNIRLMQNNHDAVQGLMAAQNLFRNAGETVYAQRCRDWATTAQRQFFRFIPSGATHHANGSVLTQGVYAITSEPIGIWYDTNNVPGSGLTNMQMVASGQISNRAALFDTLNHLYDPVGNSGQGADNSFWGRSNAGPERWVFATAQIGNPTLHSEFVTLLRNTVDTTLWNPRDVYGFRFGLVLMALTDPVGALPDMVDALPTISLSTSTVSLAENTSTTSAIKLADITIGDDLLGSPVELSLSGPQAGLFEIVAGALYLRAGAALDFDTSPSVSVTVDANDPGIGGPVEDSKTFTITVTNVNEQPTALNLSANTIPENSASGTTIGTFSSSDPDAGSSFTYTLVTGTGSADNASFSISGNSLRSNAVFNFETTPTRSIRVRTTDQGGLSFEQAFTITVTNLNEHPSALNLSPNTIPENSASGTTVGTFSSSDPDTGNTFTYTLVTGDGSTDNSLFSISGNTLRSNAVLNFETTPNLSIRVRTTDQGGLWVEQQFTITVTDINEAPTGLAISDSSIAENRSPTATVGDFSTTDPDASNTFTYALVTGTGSTDNSSFNIVGGQLRARVTFNFEAKSTYSIRVRTTDQGGLSFERVITILVTNVNEQPFGSNFTSSLLAENVPIGSLAGTFQALDPDVGDTFTYELVPGAGVNDNDAFIIVGDQLLTNTTIDFESKVSYSVRVRMTDQGGLFRESSYSIDVGDVNEPPTALALSANTFAESVAFGALVGNFSTTDPDASNTFTYTLVTGTGSTNNAAFRIVGTQLRTNNFFDFETQSTYSIRVRTADQGGLTFERAFTISVTDVNEAPFGLNSPGSVLENVPTGSVVGTLEALDQDVGDTFTYALVPGTGSDDNAAFTIVGDQLLTNTTIDFESKAEYSIRVRMTDRGGLFTEFDLPIIVINRNERPTGLSLSVNTIAENVALGTAVGDFTTTDPDASNTFTYSLVTGTGSTDNAAFTIVGSQLRTNSSLNFETKGTYSIRVRTTDQGGLTFEQPFTISVTNVNEQPTNLSISSATVAESVAVRTAVGDFTTTDPDASNTFTYTLVTGTGSTDNAAFTIAGGQLRTNSAIDFETQSAYSIRVRTTDQGGLFFERVFTISVTNLNEQPTALALSVASVLENAASGTGVGTFMTTDPDASSTFTYSLVTGTGSTGNASFTIVGNELRTNAVLDFETQASYSIRVRTTDQGGLFLEQVFVISVTDVNETPTALALSATTVAENVAAGTGIGTFSTTDPDASNTFTYSLVTGTGSTGNASFVIVGNQLQANQPFDFESQTSYSIRVRATDQGGLFFERTFTISVTNVNETPTTLNLSNASLAENVVSGTTIGTFSTVDPDASNTFTYTLVSGTGSTDNVWFSIVSGQLRNNASFDFDTKSSYSIRVRTTDQGGLFHEGVFTISVTNVNETPTGLALSNASVAENSATGTAVGTFTTTDPDAGNTFTYSLVSGTGSTHNTLFTIVGNELRTNSVFNFEVQTSYSIRARTTDQGGLISERSFTISITNVNEQPTIVLLVITTVPENTAIATAFGTFETTDPDAANTFTYTLEAGTGSTDNALFSIAGNLLRTNAVFDFETRSSYSIRVRTTDQGGLFLERVFTIGITNVFEAPTALALSNGTVAENSATGTGVGTFSTTDQDAGNTFTYTLVTGTGSSDNGVFAIVANQLRTNGVFDFEGRSSYSIRVRTTDQGGLFFEQVFVISVTDVNEAPTGLALSNAVLAEDVVSGTAVGTLSASDQDAGNTFTYTLVAGTGGADNGVFAIDGDQLRTNGVFDFEGRSTYSIRVRTTDQGGLSFERAFTISITNVNETPTAVGLSNAVVPEGLASGATVGAFSTSDPDGANTFTYTLVTGTGEADNGLFAIVGGALRTNGVFDFEGRTSYSIRVRSTDQGGLFVERAFTIGVTNVNEAPTGVGLSNSAVLENEATGTVIGTLSATDPDVGNTFTYALVAGAGATGNGAFLVVGNELRVNGVLNFEGQSSYSIRVRASDQGNLFFEREFTIRVIDGEDAPTGVGLANTSVVENAPSGTVVGTLSTTDVDAGDTFTYSLVNGAGGADNGAFAVVGNELRTGAPFDFEGRSSYSVRVRTTDRAGLLFERSLTITIDDVNEAPTGVNLSANLLVENAAAGTVVGTLSTVDPDTGNTHTVGLVAGAGGEDNGSFTITGGVLRSAGPLDFEAGGTRSIRVRTTDGGGLFLDRVFTISLGDVNEAPTDLVLSSTTVSEGAGFGVEIGTLSTVDQDAANTFGYSLTAGAGDADNGQFVVFGNRLRLIDPPDFEKKPSYTVRIRTTDQNFLSFEKSFVITVTDEVEAQSNVAPVLDHSGNTFAILGVGSRQSVEMREGVTVASILARGANGQPISDVDAGAVRGIAITGADTRLGTFQYTLVADRPGEGDWIGFGAVSDASALLLPETARVRFVTGLIPHHVAAGPFLPLESKLDTGLTFRAWDRTTGTAGSKGDATTTGGTSAFSEATETVRVYFEARLFRSFNANAQLNVYTLEAEFNALTTNPAFVDRSTSAYSGFTILMSAVPELGTVPLFRMYYGVQFNDDGTETDMGYRYLTSNGGEAAFLEGLGRADKRAAREGAYFRELGVNGGTAIVGYIHANQQPGTSRMTQVYRLDMFPKPTRPSGTREGDRPTSMVNQQQGDHVYTTNTRFETGRPGTWVIEADRGFVRELSPNPTGVSAVPVAVPAVATNDGPVAPFIARTSSDHPAVATSSTVETVSRLIAVSKSAVVGDSFEAAVDEGDELPSTRRRGASDETEETAMCDEFFSDAELVGASGWGV